MFQVDEMLLNGAYGVRRGVCNCSSAEKTVRTFENKTNRWITPFSLWSVWMLTYYAKVADEEEDTTHE